MNNDMDASTFRQWGHQMVDWIADYLEHPERYPVLSQVAPGEIRNALPAEPPRKPQGMDTIFTDFERVIVPGLTHWNHPGFFAYFAITASMPGILGELLSAALNQQAMLWRTSPAATELEEVTMGWLRQLLGLPEAFEGVIYDTASIASMHALAAAREAVDLDVRSRGLSGMPRMRVYCSEHAHSSIDKSVITLGLGHDSLRKIPSDEAFRMRADALEEAIKEDRASGWLPIAVVATVGTTSTTSVDPVPVIADICEREKLWLHVDAAYAGVAAMVPELRGTMEGCDRADSLVTNPHKWLFVPFDLSAFFCRRMPVLRQAFSLVPEYLKTSDPTSVKNLMDTGVQLGRRFRSLKLWFVMRWFGADGLAEHLQAQVRMARWLADQVEASADFELLAPVPFSVVCLRACPAGVADLDALNEAMMEAINKSGRIFLSHTRLNGKMALRIAIGNLHTTQQHVEEAWQLLQQALQEQLTRV